MSKKSKVVVEEMSILDAVDNLTSLAELDELEGAKATMDIAAARWIEKGREEESLKKVKQTFRVVHNYLKDIYIDKKEGLKDEGNQKGVQAIMTLAVEAANKLDRYSNLFKGMEGTTEDLEEFRNLQTFYKEKLAKRFSKSLKAEDKEEWEAGEDDHLDIERRGLRDLETVKRDQKYELFYLNKEDGKPFYNKNLLRHIKLVNDFDALFANLEHDDPFMKLNLLFDKDLHSSATQMREEIQKYVKTFYRSAHNEMRTELISALYSALSALSLATVNHNQIKNTAGKSCSLYFADFHNFLRQALSSAEYFHHVNHNGEILDPLTDATIKILHHVAYQFFTRAPRFDETTGWIHSISLHEPSKKRSQKSSLAFWNDLLDTHEMIVRNLQKFPSGPLFKTLDVFRDRAEIGGFDPLAQHNLPHELFPLHIKKQKTRVLRIPTPTHQTTINEATVVDEFQAFLRECKEKKKVYVMCNLQDRTSWEESSRCEVLEELQRRAEFSDCFFVITIPKYTDFYHQSAEYLEISKSSDFIATFHSQLANYKECGFFFPKRLSASEIQKFFGAAIDVVHKRVFAKKKVLTRKNRLDFIEIVFQLFNIYLIETLKPDYISFTCKDSVDTGAVAAAGLFGFIKTMNEGPEWSGEEQDFFHWMVFSAALTIRERSIEGSRLSRMVSMLSSISAELETEGEKLRNDFAKLFPKDIFAGVKVDILSL